MQISVERTAPFVGITDTMTNDKTTPAVSPSNYSQDGYQRSLSESEYFSPRSKRPHYETLPDAMQNVYETKKYHRLIEKRRRDRINECIYQLKDMLPADVIKSTSKPMEKAVILELVVKHMQSISRSNKGGRSAEYARGYQDCVDQTLNYMKTDLNDGQKNELRTHLQQKMTFAEPPKARHTNGNGTASSVISSLSNAEDSSRDKQSCSSSSLSSSSPVSDFSLCADNSDSSGGQDMLSDHKFAKRKVYSHHHKSSANANQGKRQQPTSVPSSNANQNQAPVFINMPFMMTPNMVPTAQFVTPDGTTMCTEAQMPRMVQSFPVSSPGGVMVPQMGTDANGVQFPAFFMSCGPQQRNENHKPQQQQQQPQNSDQGVMLQPVMMPMRNQSNFMFMPTYPVMPQFQTPTLVPVQTSTEEHTSPSE